MLVYEKLIPQKKAIPHLIDRCIFQHAKENQVHRHDLPPQQKLEEDEVMTEGIVLDSLRRALDQVSCVQARDGHWPGGYSGVFHFAWHGRTSNGTLQLLLVYISKKKTTSSLS